MAENGVSEELNVGTEAEIDVAGHGICDEEVKVVDQSSTSSENEASSHNLFGPGQTVDLLDGIERYKHVEGFEGRLNDLIYCPPLSMSAQIQNGSVDGNYLESNLSSQGEAKVAIYFGGDIQDFPEIMQMHREHRHYTKWSLESTALILRGQFPFHHIVIVRPSRMQMLTFSCFDNFVPCNNTGVPEHTPNHNSLQHLEILLENLSCLVQTGPKIQTSNENRVNNYNGIEPTATGGSASITPAFKNTISTTPEMTTVVVSEISTEHENERDSFVSSTTTEEISGSKNIKDDQITSSCIQSNKPTRVNPHLELSKITLIGFSKGCVVLNQFLYEFHYLKTLTPDDDSMEGFLSRIEHMYWLDGGHNGGKNTWITSRALLETLKRLGVRIHVHMTPYQLTDERRPWIRKEEKMFSDSLEHFGARIHRHVHFENESPSLDLHLKLLAEFGTVEDDTEEDPDDDDDDYDECIEMC